MEKIFICNHVCNILKQTKFCNLAFRHLSNKVKNTINEEDGGTIHENKENVLYDGYIKTSIFQRTTLAIGSAFISIMDPRRHDMIAVCGETTGYYGLRNVYEKMLQCSEGSQVLKDKPRINTATVNIDKLSQLPIDSFGYAYSKFLTQNKVTPDTRLTVRFVDDCNLAYVLQRYREVHDLLHTVLGMPTNMQGEVAVKWVEALQTGLPMCVGGALFGPLRFKPKQRMDYVDIYLPWALRVGRAARPLMNIYYEHRWEQNLNDLREELLIESPP